MRCTAAHSPFRLLVGVSALALATVPSAASAQDGATTVGQSDDADLPTAATLGQPGDSEIQDPALSPEPGQETGEIVVTGIRASLRESMNIKRNAQGVVDAISAEDIGKFPDTNLAESLQRITGVSIDRSNGEGSTVTVRGFGPEFNLVLLNGRQMPTATLGDGASPPASRSFDFANLAAEGVAAVEVYKSGRAALPTGGIGSTINILTPRPLDRPGMRGSVSVKGVLDSSMNDDQEITPEISGIYSNTIADERIGILLTGSYQRRKASVNTASVSWRDGYLGSENNWGSLPQEGDGRFDNIVNRPGPNDVYEVQQEGSYGLSDIDRERINGQLVLQFEPVDSLRATFDYTFSQNTVEVRNNSVGVWFNFNDVASEWTDGPVAGPVFYSENFGANERKDLSYSGSLTANRSINHSLGGNLAWDGPGGLSLQLDAHHSTAESKPTNDFGTSISVGNAVFGVANQTFDYTNDLPIISVDMHAGIDPLDASLVTSTGNSFRNAYFHDEIDQVRLLGTYDFDTSFLDSVDFGVSYVENKVRSAYGFIQNETWSGAGPASDIPDDIFELVSLPDKFAGVQGSNDPNMIQSFYRFDVERMIGLIEDLYQVCSEPGAGAAEPGTCLAEYTTDRRLKEKTVSPFIQANAEFDLFQRPAHLRAGVRYEETKVTSSALVPIPTGTRWTGNNEFAIDFAPERDFTTFEGKYDHWLPAFDADFEPIRDVKLRASYSHTIARADYASLQGGLSIDSNPRIGGGTGNQGNPGLLPYKSKNIDVSAEWYYGPSSYVSVGYFNKDVENFISTTRFDTTAFDLTNPADGPRYLAAVAALGANASLTDIRNYIFENYPDSVNITGQDEFGNYLGDIIGLPEDNLFNFEITTPFNSEQKANLNGWEFAIQHSFWNTGFGAILNYTIVNGDTEYNNTLPASAGGQFALTGMSDSANAVLFYDKGPIQARVAYNWRDKFLTATGVNPFYVEAYGQIDASASYEFPRGITAFVEVINLTGESRRGHRRHENNVFFASPGFARYSGGVRVTF